MRIKRESVNGNLNANIRYGVTTDLDSRTGNWPETRTKTNSVDRENSYVSVESQNVTRNLTNISNRNAVYYRKNSERIKYTVSFQTNNLWIEQRDSQQLICNNQYRINRNNLNNSNKIDITLSSTLDGSTGATLSPSDHSQDNSTISAQTTPIEAEERAFELSDTDETSENGHRPLPRGIVNPNYPGFQHLAHTLQDYSSNIEHFYHSENDMTDDDVDIDITETNCELECPLKDADKNNVNLNNNNNNNYEDKEIQSFLLTLKENEDESKTINKEFLPVPDLLKNVTKNNNNSETTTIEISCSDADLENNFCTENIIGDFNKEIENEIRELLNYNINIQDDLEELRKDIKDNFAKPIESTINNITEVVNQVIKKLVETKVNVESDRNDSFVNTEVNLRGNVQILSEENENEKNTGREMSLSRPTFLLLEPNISNKITDAFLSDGKDEIVIDEQEYNTEELSKNVENTIKQLSCELRKIIPKLETYGEPNLYWHNQNGKCFPTDNNFNKIAGSSKMVDSSLLNAHSIRINPVSFQCKNDFFKCDHGDYSYGATEKNETQYQLYNTELSCDRGGDRTSNTSPKRRSQDISSTQKDSLEDYDTGSFDVYNIETAMPALDFDAIESHLKAAKEAERRKRNDREEIRRRLAMGVENDDYYSVSHIDRPGKKPSLHSRLQGGMNLQICFMNETASDNESQASDVEKNSYSNRTLSRSSIFSKSNYSLNNHPYQTRPLSVSISKTEKAGTITSGGKLRLSSLSTTTKKSRSTHSLGNIELKESDFYALQATLQTEARIALAQAKELARIQTERERRSRPVSPVTEMLRRSMDKACAPLPPDRRRVSRQLLTHMNVAQLQVIVNELHSQIEALNEGLVRLLMARDDLHMGQDSMLVDIEDLTRYLGVKEQTKKTKGNKVGVKRFTSLVNK